MRSDLSRVLNGHAEPTLTAVAVTGDGVFGSYIKQRLTRMAGGIQSIGLDIVNGMAKRQGHLIQTVRNRPERLTAKRGQTTERARNGGGQHSRSS